MSLAIDSYCISILPHFTLLVLVVMVMVYAWLAQEKFRQPVLYQTSADSHRSSSGIRRRKRLYIVFLCYCHFSSWYGGRNSKIRCVRLELGASIIIVFIDVPYIEENEETHSGWVMGFLLQQSSLRRTYQPAFKMLPWLFLNCNLFIIFLQANVE